MRIFRKYIPALLCAVLAVAAALAQGGWIQRANKPGNGMQFGQGAAIGNNGYLCCDDYQHDVQYKYSSVSKTWDTTSRTTSQGPYFYGQFSSFAGAVGGKVYYGLGSNNSFNYGPDIKKVIAYDPVLDTWTPRASFPGLGRSAMAYFVLNSKIYVAGGHLFGGGGSICCLNDLWEYTPATDTWLQRASIPVTGLSGPVGFAVDSLGYVACGNYIGTSTNQLWRYSPASDTWVQKASYPGGGDMLGAAFTIGSTAYYLRSGSGGVGSLPFYSYTPATDTWLQLPNFPGPAVAAAAYFTIGNSGFVATGGVADLWEYNLTCPANITHNLRINAQPAFYCTAAAIDTIYADHLSGNPAYQWLRSSGSNPFTAITGATGPDLAAQSISQTTRFRRVAYFNSSCFDTSAIFTVAIQPFQAFPLDTLTPTHLCEGDTAILYCGSPYTKLWLQDGGPLPDTGQTIHTGLTASYQVITTNGTGCSDTSVVRHIIIMPLPAVPLITRSGSLLSSTTAPAYQWFSSATGLIAGATQQSYAAPGAGSYSVEITGLNGCKARSAAYSFVPDGIRTPGAGGDAVVCYPNPAHELLSIANRTASDVSLRICNIYGACIATLAAKPGQASLSLRDAGIGAGLYFIDFEVAGRRVVQKLVVE